MGAKTNTQTTTSGPPPQVAQAYGDLLNRAQGVASTPYQQYQGNLLAPFSGSQQQAFQTIDQSQGIAQPYINQAQQYATQGAAPITGQQIGQYLNPYTQDVINSTQANFNEGNAQQQAQVRGNAIQQGALGNSRTGVAQAELARQQQLSQAPVIAGLESQGYNTALGAAQQDAARQGQAAYTFGNLGQEAQGSALTGAQAQLTSGGLQQQQTQAGLNIPYQQFLQQQAFPYQQLGWLAGIDTGVGSNMGGTSTTQSPGPNPYVQGAGLGIAGLGALGAAGGSAGIAGLAPLALALATGGAVREHYPTAPENKETLHAQQKQLIDGHRHVQMFPSGTDELPLPSGTSRLKMQHGVFHYNPDKIHEDHIKHLASKGRENEFLGLGPHSKSEIEQRIKHGEKPLAVVERNGKGVEVRAALGTDKTVHAQMAALNHGKSPGHTVSVEDASSVVAARHHRAFGGRIGYADGGAPGGISGMPYAGAQSWIPAAQITHGSGPPRAPGQMADPNASANKMVAGAMDLANKIKGNSGIAGAPLNIAPAGVDTSDPSGVGGIDMATANATGPDLGGLYRRGGMVAHGGAVLPSENGIFVPRGYAEGGTPNFGDPNLIGAYPADVSTTQRIGEGFQDADAAIEAGIMDPRGANQGNPVLGYSGNIPLPRPRPDEAGIAVAGGPPSNPGIASDGTLSDHALSFSPDTTGIGIAPAQQPQGQSWNDKFHSIAPALMAAGFGMMASRSPFLGTAIGEGGLAGVNAYNQQKKLEQEQANTEKQSAQGEERIQQESKRLDQAAKDAAARLKLQTQQFAEQQQQHVIEKAKPVKIGVDKMGNDIMGVFDPASGAYKPINAPAPMATSAPTTEGSAPPLEVRAQAPAASAQARDESYLATLAKQDPGYAANIKAIADYQSSPNIFSRRNNRYEKAMADVYQYDPTYDSRRYNQTNKAIQAFSTGKQGDAVRSFNVAIEHLGTAEELGKALENGDVQLINSLKNTIKTQFGYDAPPSFETAKTIVADEIAKAVIGGQNAEGDRRDLQKRLSVASSPSQLADVIKTFKTLMGGQVIGYKKQYEDTTGLKNFDDRLTPRTRAELERIGNSSGSPAANTPPTVTNKSQYDALPSGKNTPFVGSDGKQYVKP